MFYSPAPCHNFSQSLPRQRRLARARSGPGLHSLRRQKGSRHSDEPSRLALGSLAQTLTSQPLQQEKRSTQTNTHPAGARFICAPTIVRLYHQSPRRCRMRITLPPRPPPLLFLLLLLPPVSSILLTILPPPLLIGSSPWRAPRPRQTSPTRRPAQRARRAPPPASSAGRASRGATRSSTGPP